MMKKCKNAKRKKTPSKRTPNPWADPTQQFFKRGGRRS